MNPKFEPIIGIEIHIELATQSKMFCACDAHHFQVEPNTHTCPVCLGLPGALPVPNKRAIEWALLIGQALHCQLQQHSKFDRKHYFYPDLPKGYQISQYDEPLCLSGYLDVPQKSKSKRIRITRAHLEEDTGKLKHETVDNQKVSLVDFNRSSVPLVEIVTEPDFDSGELALAYAKSIQRLVRFLEVSDADMEKGSMRLEANISLIPASQKIVDANGYRNPSCFPDYKVEVKNINSFRYLKQAIEYEIRRQATLLEKGIIPTQETRGWNEKKQATVSQRSKESAKDYRYFPDPDIPPLEFSRQQLDAIIKSSPHAPEYYEAKLKKAGIRHDYIQNLTQTPQIAKWSLQVLTESIRFQLSPHYVFNFIVNSKINPTTTTPQQVINTIKTETEQAFLSELETSQFVKEVITSNQKLVAKYHSGKTNVIGAFIGQVVKNSGNRVDPQLVKSLLIKALE